MSYNIYLGNNIVDNIYLGNTEITEAYLLGSKLNLFDALAPSDLTLTVLSDTSIKLDWTVNSTNADGHKIERSTDGVTYAEITTVTGATATYTNTGLTDFTTYYYRVRAYKDSRYSAYCTAANIKTTSAKLIITIKTDNVSTSANDTVIIPFDNTFNNFRAEWGDGLYNDYTGNQTGITHTYATSGIYTVKLSGATPRMRYGSYPSDKEKIINIDNWGTGQWATMNRAFYYCKLMYCSATDTPDWSICTSLEIAFGHCEKFNGDLSGVNISNVTTLYKAFEGALVFNSNVSSWNTANVKSMNSAFFACHDFVGGDLTGWDTSSVTDMQYIFFKCHSLNVNISNWDVSKVTLFSYAFYECALFNSNISGWDTGLVTDMNSMFYSAVSFNQNISSWNTANVTLMSNMFDGASAFNQNINGWNTANVTSMSGMFKLATSFNQSLNSWDTSKVTTMANMFRQATAFNGNISSWNTGSVTSFFWMFFSATSFNQDISSWVIANVTTMASMLSSASSFSTANYSALLIGFAAQTVQPSVTLNASAKYSAGAAATARGVLTGSPNSWTITDGGQVP